MANIVVSPNMNLPIPVPGQELGPAWAQDISNCLGATGTGVDGHNHAPGNGVYINPNGININNFLTFNNNDATTLRTVRFNPQTSPIAASAPDLGCLYESVSDLYYNDGAGNQIRITQGGSLAGAAGTITGLPSGTASASYSSISGTFVFQSAAGVAANIDAGSLIVRYPGSYPTITGTGIAIQCPSSVVANYSLTLPPFVTATPNSFLVMATDGTLSYKYVDTVTLGYVGNELEVLPGGITTTQISASAGILGSQLSASAAILGSQLSASAGIVGTQIVSDVNLQGKSCQEAGQNLVTSNANATNSLSILRGIVNAAGSELAGEGWTSVRNSTGVYTIAFNVPFFSGDTPIITMTPASAQSVISVSAVNSGGFVATIVNNESPYTVVNDQFHFICVGQRA